MGARPALPAAAALLLWCRAAWGQHHHDPFAGSGCNCTAFCAGRCAINASAPQNMTLYRMTPLGIDSATDKNTGDARGDTSYVLSRRTSAFDCKKRPGSWSCATLVVKGDDPDSTDLVIAFTIEVDGQWGPYLYCNPTDAKHPDAPWNCTASLSGGAPPNYPPQCKAANYSGYTGYCYSHTPDLIVPNVALTDCCAAASAHNAYAYRYFTTNLSCGIYMGYAGHADKCADGVSGLYSEPSGPSAPACDCPRVHAAIGRQNLTSGGYGSYNIAGGEWYSHPHEGECAAGRTVLDGGCSWRAVGVEKAVNASCVYDRVDAAVEATDPACFAECPKGAREKYNRTTGCYSKCYSTASRAMGPAALAAPWERAFARDGTAEGGCPPVELPPGRRQR